MKRRLTALLLAVCMAVGIATVAAEDAEIIPIPSVMRQLKVGNPTAMQGRFFTDLWGGTTSDLDVQELLHACSPVTYDIGTYRFRYDQSIIQNAIALEDEEGNRDYLIVLYDNLKYSDGSQITAWDYAFSILFRMDKAIAETGGKPADYSWILGAEEYLEGTSQTLKGVRVIDTDMIQITAKTESLPYFWELGRLNIHPYPASVIAPGIAVKDDGEGVYLSEPLTAEMIRKTVLDPETGYLSHPGVVSGPYTLESFDGTTATFRINEYYKGNEAGYLPAIPELEYTAANNLDMMEKLETGEFGLLNKVTKASSIQQGFRMREEDSKTYATENYMRTGLTMIWFEEKSRLVQEQAVRQAVAYCFDRETFVEKYTEDYGLITDGFYGLGQWMYLQASGNESEVNEEIPEEEREALRQAYAGITLDGLTKYSSDTAKAVQLLDGAGWKLNAQGKRTKRIDGAETQLVLTLGIPESEETWRGLQQTFLRNLFDAGIDVNIVQMSMDEIVRAYRGETEGIDLLYLGEDFSLIFDPALLQPTEEAAEGAEPETSLTAAKAALYAQALEMVRTEPADGAGFLRKWVGLQEKITETLPMIPVYSNVYFDFFRRELHRYRITESISWGDAIVKSYLSDPEEPEPEIPGTASEGSRGLP